jgi:uncharacterized coiled-coil protein SlyX
MNDKNREPSRHEHERGAPLVDDCDNWCKGKYSKWSAAREGGGMTIQKYHLGWDYEEADMYPSENGDYVLYTDHLAEIAEKERSVHEKYKKELITQNDQLDRYEEQIAALTARIKELESRPQFGNDEVGRIKDKYGQRIKELESILNLVGEDPVWVSLHVEQRYEICRLEKRIKELEEERYCLKEDFKIAVQTRNEL